jgi:hypothetical protein
MKKSIKVAFEDAFFKLYGPYMVRKEKLHAVKMWQQGVHQCIQMYKEIGSPRVYLFYDRKHNVWSPMTYEKNKLLKPSLRVLRSMGKLRGSNLPYDVNTMKRKSYYYTPSKWGALGCSVDNAIRKQKLQMWITYYLCELSKPMKKYRDYQQGYDSRHPHQR